MEITFLELLRYALSIALLIALVAGAAALIVWLRRGAYSSVSPGYTQAMALVAEKLVLAAEQYYRSGEGQKKKQWVLDQIEEWTKRRRIPFDPHLADALIESAVYLVINGPDGTKAKEVKVTAAVMNAGADPRALPFVKGEAPITSGPPPVELVD